VSNTVDFRVDCVLALDGVPNQLDARTRETALTFLAPAVSRSEISRARGHPQGGAAP